MRPDDFAGYRPHQIRRLLRRGRRAWAPGQGPKKEENSSLFPGGNVRLLTSAPDWAFTGPNQLPTFPGPGDPTRIAVLSERSESKGLHLASAESLAILPTGQPGTCRPDEGRHPERAQRVEGPHARLDEPNERIEIVALQTDDINNEMNEDSSLNESPEIQRSPEIEDDQEPEVELPLPVIVALQEREARRQNTEEEFAGAARTEEFTGAPSSAPYAEGGSIRTSRSRRSDEDISLSHHAARCSICQHPDRDAIEQGYLHWESPTLLAYEYGLGQRRAVYRHARAFGLREKRGARTRRSLEFVIEQGENVTATADSLVRAVRAYSCLGEDGRWTEPAKRVIITHEHIDVVREADSGPSLATRHSPALRSQTTTSKSPQTQGHAPATAEFEPSLVTSHSPLVTESVTLGGRASSAQNATLGDGHAVPSKNAVTPAPPTKVEKLMDTLFNRFAR